MFAISIGSGLAVSLETRILWIFDWILLCVNYSATEDKNNIVYEIDCSNCEAIYFGESKFVTYANLSLLRP